MVASVDSLEAELNKLKRIFRAQQSGIPDRLVVMVTGAYSKTPEAVRKAITDRLAPYGLSDEEDAQQAGCELTVCVLPWLTEREVGNLKIRLEDQPLTSLNVETT